MNIAYVLVQSTIGHEMEVLSDLLKIDLVKEISQKQIFRGPDEQNFYVSKDNRVCLGNNRLSVIDKKNGNTIILIYNHGQDKHDAPLKDCSWKNNLRNSVSLLGKKIKGKQIMVYNFCTNNLAGDDYTRL